MAALVVALIAAAIFTGFSTVSDLAGASRHQGEAGQLAQQDEQRLRGLSVAQLVSSEPSGSNTPAAAASYGNASYQQTIDGETYTVTSSARFVSASSGSFSCSTGGTGSADYIATDSEVTWANSNDNRAPVQDHSLIAPVTGGTIIGAVQDNYNPLNVVAVPGGTITIEGPSPSVATQSAQTDSSGCAVFTGLAAGAYTVTANAPAGYSFGSNATQQAVTLTNDGSETTLFHVAQLATINATFQTVINGGAPVAIPFDTFSLEGSPPTSYGTQGSYVSPPTTVSTGAALYPSSSTGYDAYAGTCSADDPGAAKDTSVPALGDGATTAITINVPSMLLGLTTNYSNSGGTAWINDYPPSSTLVYSGSGWSHQTNQSGDYNSDETDGSNAGNSVKLTFTGTQVSWIGTKSYGSGYANVSLDGGSPQSINTASTGSTLRQQTLYTSPVVSNGQHTLTITVTGQNGNSGWGSGSSVSIDAFTVTSPPANSSATVSSWPSTWTIVTYDSCSTPVERDPPTLPVATTVGSATVFPVAAPYGTSVQVCVANSSTNTNTGALPSGATQIQNTDFSGSTTTQLALPTTTTATGTSAIFGNSGACPT